MAETLLGAARGRVGAPVVPGPCVSPACGAPRSPCPRCARRDRRSSALKLPKKKARRRHTDVRHRPAPHALRGCAAAPFGSPALGPR